jgi:MFS family permease
MGGEMLLNRKAAETALRSRVAEPLGVDLGRAAAGMLEVAKSAICHVGHLAIVAGVVSMGAVPSTLGLYIHSPELYPTRMRAWGTAAATTMNHLAQTVGPALAGILIASTFGSAAVFALNGMIAVVGALTGMWLGIETKGRVLEEIAA